MRKFCVYLFKNNIFYKTIILLISSSPYTLIGKLKYTLNLIPIVWFKYIYFLFKFLRDNNIFFSTFPIILIKNDNTGRLKKITINTIDRVSNKFISLKLYRYNSEKFIKPEINALMVLKEVNSFEIPKINSIFKYKDWQVLSFTNELNYLSIPNNLLPNKYILNSLLSIIERTIIYQKDGTLTCLSHGDFTPWNIRINENLRTKVLIFDWEYSFISGTIFYDFFYFILMTSHALGKNIPTEIQIMPIFKIFIQSLKNMHIMSNNNFSIKEALNQTLELLYKRSKYNQDKGFYQWLKLNNFIILNLFEGICNGSK